MANKKKEVVEELQQDVPVVKPTGSDEKVEDKPLKVKTPAKRKMKNLGQPEDNVIKVDLNKAEETKEEKSEVAKVDLSEKKEEKPKEEVVEEIKEEQPEKQEEKVEEETPVVEEITDEVV